MPLKDLSAVMFEASRNKALDIGTAWELLAQGADEIVRLRALGDSWAARSRKNARECAKRAAKIERLRIENEMMREFLEASGFKRMLDHACAALKERK